jgi:hypothetical protein
LQTGQRLKDKEAVTLGTGKGTKEIYCTQTKQNGKGLKSCFAWNYKPTTKQTNKGKSIALAKLQAKR